MVDTIKTDVSSSPVPAPASYYIAAADAVALESAEHPEPAVICGN